MAKEPNLLPTEIASFPQAPLRKTEDYLKAYTGYVYTAVSAISQEVSSISLHLYKRKFLKGKPAADEILEHAALSLLYYVNPYCTFYELIESTQVYLDLVGEAFWVIFKDQKGRPAEIWPLRPDWVKIKPSATKVVDKYIYNPGGQGTKEVEFDPEMIIHFKYFNTTNLYRGRGSVQAAAMPIDIHNFAQEWNRNFFFNSAIPSLIFTTDQKVNEVTVKRFMESWQNKFGGRGNSNKAAFLTGGFKVDKATMNAKEMDFVELQRVMRDDILAVFKVPKTVLGLTEDVNRANAEATTRAFMERVITPRMKKLVAHLNEFYLPLFEENIFFDFDDPSPEDTELKLSIYKSGLGGDGNTPWMTINEVRENENMPPVEGGDVIYVGFGQVPLGTEPPEPQAFGGNKPDDDKEDDKEGKSILDRLFGRKQNKSQSSFITLKPKGKTKKTRKFMMGIPPKTLRQLRWEAEKKEIKLDFIKLISNLMKNGGGIKRKKKSKTKSIWSEEKRLAHWTKFVSTTDVLEDKMKLLMIPLMNDQEDLVKRNLDTLKHYHRERRKGKESSFLFAVDDETKIWVARLIPFLRDVLLQEGANTLEFLGVGGQLDISQGRASTYLREEAANLIKDINVTTREELRKTLAEGLKKGESIDQLKERVSSVFIRARGPRAEMIARTEILRASNFATNEGYLQSEVVEAKEWLTAPDCTDPFCLELEGKIIDVEDSYFNSGDTFTANGKTMKVGDLDVGYPPLHPNCRCTVIPVLIS